MTQINWIGFRGDYFKKTTPKNTIAKTQFAAVNQNCKNFFTESKIFLPYLIAATIEQKLSSSKIIPDAALATSVPTTPIENPTFAFSNGGALQSLVVATMLSSCLRPITTIHLSYESDYLANTLSWSLTFLKFSMF